MFSLYYSFRKCPELNFLDEREYVVLTSRVHPGESNASWCMKGVINYLLSDCEKANQLRNKFIFKVRRGFKTRLNCKDSSLG